MKLKLKIKIPIIVLLLITLMFSGSFANGKDLKYHEYLLKAVFLERFTRFIEWPLYKKFDDHSEPFVIGVINSNPFNSMLETLYKNQNIKEKPVDIRYIKKIKEINGCHLLFIGNTSMNSLTRIIESIRDYPILTISDSKGYCHKGVHINMYIDENNQIRFEINNKAASHSGLSISYLLLKVARLVERSGEEQ